MVELLTGTVTFLLTDIEGSTALWEREPAAMQQAAARHDALIEQAVADQGGVVVRPRGEGDSRFAVFARASDAVAAALALQWDLAAEPWPASAPLRVRVALHTGEAELREGDYYGTAVNRCARLRAVAHGGQVLLSQATYDLVRDALPDAGLHDLGDHRLRDLVRPERVYQLVQPGVATTFPTLRSLDAYPHNLPLQLTSFVGREHEVAEVGRLLASHRLVTLTGVGGGGKTRLALQVAADVIDAHPDGVWFVDLAPLTDPVLVPHTVAAVLGVREQPGQPMLSALLLALRARHLLLILDNCEHLLDACVTLAEALLQGCPSLRVLATSREALGSAGEVPWRIPSLVTPDPDHLPPLDALMELAAVRLFVERARVVQPTFVVTADNATAVARVCRRLDGIPLALELAAARLIVLSSAQIAARLDDRFRLLTGGRRTAMRRQQTLAAALDWSYDLLTEPERVLLRRLAVFAGGFILEAAEAVGAGDGIADWQVLDLLTQLVAKSLVVVEAAGDAARYRLLETVRQYAEDKLLAAGESAAARDRHAAWCAALAARGAPAFGGPAQGAWLDRLEAEHDNLRAALNWLLEADAAAGLALATDLGEFWMLHGYEAEGIQWLAPFLVATPDRTVVRARALLVLAEMVRYYEGQVRARPLTEEALALCRDVGDVAGQVIALAHLGNMAATAGDLAAARDHLAASLALLRAQGDQRALAQRLRELGLIDATGGDLEQARVLFEESLALARATGATYNVGVALLRLGILDRLEGEYARSRARLEEGLALLEAARYPLGVLLARAALANLARAEGRFDEAQAGLRAGLRDLLTGAVALLPEYLVQFGILAVAEGDPAWGVRLIAVQVARSGVIGSVHTPDVRLEGEAALARARAALGEAAFAAAWAEGEALTLDDAVAEALTEGGDDG